MADEALQTVLAKPTDAADFAALALEAAARTGIALAPEELGEIFRRDPLGLSRLAGTVPNASKWPARQWLPVSANAHGVDWAHFAGAKLSEPLFEQSARSAAARPFNFLFRHVTSFESFMSDAGGQGSLPPRGLIFHMSRCGSTLVAQMLAALPRNHVVSEAPPLDAMVRMGRSEGLRAMIAALGRGPADEADHYFLKLDFWHAFALPLFRTALPSVPWIFLYRDPVEVLVSQMRQRGIQSMPEMLAPYVPALGQAIGLAPEQGCARVIAAACEAALQALGTGGGLAVNYSDLPDAIGVILDHFGASCGETERAAMEAAVHRDAKAPARTFAPDSEAKREAATEAIRAAAAVHLGDPYRRLEAARARPL